VPPYILVGPEQRRTTVTAKGQVTLRKAVLRHLGIKPGDKIEIALLDGGTRATGAAGGAQFQPAAWRIATSWSACGIT
jgi:AbrB family looped-hinge helix DNA binding protein